MQSEAAGESVEVSGAAPRESGPAADPGTGWRALRFVAWPFWNGSERRPRALWRLVGFALIMALLGRLGRPMHDLLAFDPPFTAFAFALRSLQVALTIGLATWLAARLLERRPLGDFGLRPSRAFWADLGFGLLLGAALMSLAFGIESAAGWVRVTAVLPADPSGLPFGLAFVAPLVLFVGVGFYEELFSRGYLLRLLAEGLNFRPFGARAALAAALLLSSALFGLGHADNPNATLVSSINIALAGAFLALPYLLTGRLALSIGVHVTWNLFQGPVYGFPVSGTTARGAQVLVIEQGGPELWTGGAFGVEGGLLCLLLLLLGSALVVGWVRWREGRVGWCTALALPPERPAPIPPPAIAPALPETA